MALANNDIQQIDNVVKLPLEKCLLYLAYLNDKALVENKEYEAALKKS